MRVLVVEDDELFREELVGMLETIPGVGAIAQAGTGREAADEIERSPPDAVLLDVHLPRDADAAAAGKLAVVGPELAVAVREVAPKARVVVISGLAGGDAVRLMLEEIVDEVVSKETPFEEIEARVTAQLRLVQRRPAGPGAPRSGTRLVGSSATMERVRDDIRRVAKAAAPVLVTGESGVGKELVARTLHEESPWARGPFLPFHAAAVGEGLLESELFGHKKGSFTGAAADRAGVVEAAEGGTLFLDEIGELPKAFQVKLLRFLEDGTFHRLGEDRPRKARVRLVFATNRDLAAEVEAGTFRKDLRYRLDVLRIEMPPLRERVEDVGEIAEHLLGVLAAQQGRRPPALDPSAVTLLRGQPWPGNVRELRNVLERALIWLEGDRLGVDPLRRAGLGDGASSVGATEPSAGGAGGGAGSLDDLVGGDVTARPLKETMEDLEREVLRRALDAHGGNVTKAAGSLGVPRRTMHHKLSRLGLRS